jgi:hypothetical protein
MGVVSDTPLRIITWTKMLTYVESALHKGQPCSPVESILLIWKTIAGLTDSSALAASAL